MIIKDREEPIHLQKLQALRRRIPQNHPKFPLIAKNLAKAQSGYKGELSIDYPLSFLDEKSFYIIHDIRLKDHNHFFQIDTLILSLYFIVNIEVKNISGTLFFDQLFHQLIRTQESKESALPDPLIQTHRHKQHLKDWLERNRQPTIPIYPLVVISNPNSLIKTPPNHQNLHQTVIHRDYLPIRISQLQQIHSKQAITEKQLKKLAKLIKSKHTPADYPILERYQIKREELLTGVMCSECSNIPLERTHNAWFCSTCKRKYIDTHKTALKDYFLLFDTTITNRQAREFLHITCPSLATRILKSHNLLTAGTRKSTIYYLK